ncbi:MAG: Complex subunit family protein [Pseudomonadota bacterium]|nr:Complex subunit family protein [Pseudomonadota bacterium]
MKIKKICVLGGTGFVGRHLATRLANQGYSLKVLTRHPQRHREIEVLPGTELIGADIHDPKALAEQFAGCDAVINLVGVLHEYANQSFHTVHAELPAKVVDACRVTGVKRLLHMSALHADAAKGPSQYLFTKGEGENTVMQATDLAVTCFKPSIIFAPDDNFYNQFAGLLKFSLALPLACPNSRFAPVYVEDVAQAFEIALDNDATIGQRYELCGPRIYTFKEIVEDIARMMGKKRMVIGLPDAMARLQAKIFGLLPVKIFSMDNYLSLQVDSVCACNGLEALGITPHSVEGIMPAHFADRPYDTLRQTARRS